MILEDKRAQLVVKDNNLIEKAKYNLTANQQKLVSYAISTIKPTDKEFKWIEISVADFCELCGIDKNHFYSDFKEMIDNLDSKAVWIKMGKDEFKFRWFSEVEIINKGYVKLMLNSRLRKFLIGLNDNFTIYELYNILAFKSKYSVRLYETFKRHSFKKEVDINIDELKEDLNAEHYINFKDFRNRVIDKAIKEINYYADLNISYTPIKKGRRVAAIKFNIEKKEVLDGAIAYRNVIDTLNKRNNQKKRLGE